MKLFSKISNYITRKLDEREMNARKAIYESVSTDLKPYIEKKQIEYQKKVELEEYQRRKDVVDSLPLLISQAHEKIAQRRAVEEETLAQGMTYLWNTTNKLEKQALNERKIREENALAQGMTYLWNSASELEKLGIQERKDLEKQRLDLLVVENEGRIEEAITKADDLLYQKAMAEEEAELKAIDLEYETLIIDSYCTLNENSHLFSNKEYDTYENTIVNLSKSVDFNSLLEIKNKISYLSKNRNKNAIYDISVNKKAVGSSNYSLAIEIPIKLSGNHEESTQIHNYLSGIGKRRFKRMLNNKELETKEHDILLTNTETGNKYILGRVESKTGIIREAPIKVIEVPKQDIIGSIFEVTNLENIVSNHLNKQASVTGTSVELPKNHYIMFN